MRKGLERLSGKVTYSYAPETWSQERFLQLGGFTVVFLNYNKARFIKRSVASALGQDFELCEMFFMDDASTDGSGDTMERLVREYRGRHKVSVVRNDENQYITGQWNVVSKLATGNWLGMFCGDDVAHPNRVRLIAERVARYPTLRGIATAAVDIDPGTGTALPDSHYVPYPYFAKGTDSWEELQKHFASNGSTSFWHKSLFREQLPRVPLDDNLLHFSVYVQNRGVDGPVFFYDSSITTIDYSLGVGVCSGGVQIGKKASARQKWVLSIAQYKKFLEKLSITLDVGLAYAKSKGLDRRELHPFASHALWCRIRGGSLLKRLWCLEAVIAAWGKREIKGFQVIRLLRAWAYFTCFECLGLNFAYTIRRCLKGGEIP